MFNTFTVVLIIKFPSFPSCTETFCIPTAWSGTNSKQASIILSPRLQISKNGNKKAILSTVDVANAPYNSITLSKTFQLDSFNIEDDLDNLNM